MSEPGSSHASYPWLLELSDVTVTVQQNAVDCRYWLVGK